MWKMLLAALLLLAACGDSEPRALRMTLTMKVDGAVRADRRVSPMFETADDCQKRVDLMNKDTERITPAQKRSMLAATRGHVEFVSISFDCVTKDEAAGLPVWRDPNAG